MAVLNAVIILRCSGSRRSRKILIAVGVGAGAVVETTEDVDVGVGALKDLVSNLACMRAIRSVRRRSVGAAANRPLYLRKVY
jgi:hypothetical protein